MSDIPRDVTALPDLLHGRSRSGTVRERRPFYVDAAAVQCRVRSHDGRERHRLRTLVTADQLGHRSHPVRLG